MTAENLNRIVAIVGRPNVGKSALFNRLAGRRIAIVHQQSGVTRDRLMREVTRDEERFTLIDTGGLPIADGGILRDSIDAGIRTQVEAALSDATVVLLVVDIEVGLVPMDEAVASLVRASGRTCIVVANKADTEARDGDSAEFDRLAFPVFPVSALHNRGVDALMEEVLAHLPAAKEDASAQPLKVAVVGRPNVGKSSYINRLLQSDRLIVSNVPGTTRDSVDIPFVVGSGPLARHYSLIDTAGIRRTGKIDNAVERFSLFRTEKTIAAADLVVHVLDAMQGPTAQDRKIASMVCDSSKGCLYLVNKWDLSEETQRHYLPSVVEALPFMTHCPVVFASAKDGYNIRRSIDVIDAVAAQIRATLPTGILNRTIEDACQRTSPPRVKGKALRIFYSTQVGQAPVRIRLFVNNPSLVKDPYRSYLVKALRRRFGLEGAPVVLHFKPRRTPEDRLKRGR